ncbi:MAG TPA: hypothetical protein VIW24_05235 [Aldersonia sp.]
MRPERVVWGSIWARYPDAVIEFDLSARGGSTDLRWTLYVRPPAPSPAAIGHLRKRMNELINANLRYTFGQ